MKKYITLCFALLLMAACQYKEDPVFEQKPTERTLSVLGKYKEVLEGHDGYWLLTYYPEEYRDGFWVYPYYPSVFTSTNEYPKYHRAIGGYNFVLKFSDGKVTTSSEVSTTNAEDTSRFIYSLAEFPILSFNTYGEILHHFSHVTSMFPNAKGGEVDFIITKEENGVFTLKGTKNENIMTLSKLTTDRETFLNKIRENSKLLKNKGLSPISVGGVEVTLDLFPSARQLAFIYEGGHKYEQQAFIFTEKGIKLYEPVTINGQTFTGFYFNDAKTALTTPDGKISSTLVATPFVPVAGHNMEVWFIDQYVSPSLLASFNTARRRTARLLPGYTLSEQLLLLTMDGNEEETNTGFYMENAYDTDPSYIWKSYYMMDFVGVAGATDQVKILINNPKDEGNYLFYSREPMEKFMTDLAKQSPYKVEEHSDEYYKLTAVRDANVWFLVKK